MQESEAERPRASIGRRLAVAAGLAGGVAMVALISAWIERQPIVVHFVGDRLAAAHVRASYRIVAIGPFEQRLEAVRIGDPAAPDLTARSVALEIGYGLHGPYLRAVRADGMRLRTTLTGGRLSLGEIDRLLPAASAAPFMLPDLEVALQDAQLALDTPAGLLRASIVGGGNLAGGFSGLATVTMPRVTVGSCTVRGVTADLRVRIEARRPHVVGPLDLASVGCTPQRLAIGAGRANLDVTFASSLEGGQGGAALVGFAGSAAGVRFGRASGLVTLAGDRRRIDGTTGMTFANVTHPLGSAGRLMLGGRYRFIPGKAGLIFAGDLAARDAAMSPTRRRALMDAGRALAGTPIAPLAARATVAIDHLLANSDADGRIAFAVGGSAGAGFSVRSLAVTGRDGGFVRVTEGDGLGWQARDRRWRIDGRIRTGGRGIPALDVRLAQPVAGAPVTGVARLAPYAAQGARLALTPVGFAATGTTTRFATIATLDGPLGSGRIEGLTVPLAGKIDMRGGFTLGEACVPLGFRRLIVGAIALDPARVSACGEDGEALVSRKPGEGVRYGAILSGIRLGGRSGAAPLTVAARGADISAGGVTVHGLAIRLGRADAITELDADSVVGTIDGHGVGGRFTGAAAQIAHVPLSLTDMAGLWTSAGGALALTGSLAVSDAATPARFAPLVARDAALHFAAGKIDATATLREPKSDIAVGSVAIGHDLGTGVGNATLAMPGLHFVPKGLQPEALTPLTLGVIANTTGTVAGHGRIDWTAQGVTSSGSFHTDGIDLAAAFGPVNRIVGTIRFTDLLGMVTAPHQEATIAEVNPGVAVSNGVVHYQLLAGQKVQVEDARWPFAGGALILEPSLLSFEQSAQRHLTFRIRGLDAAAFVQQLAFPNISATGVFDGALPMIFDQNGGRIVQGELVARRPGGTLAYVGELSNAQLGTMGKLAFDALKAIRYNSLSIGLDGRLDGEIISRVKFDGVRQATGDGGLAARLIRNLPFRFNIQIRAPFRGLMGSARAFVDPAVLLQGGTASFTQPAVSPAAVQPVESEPVR